MKNSDKTIKVALTGGIGSGKSTALEIIAKMGVRTISMDGVYEDLLKDEQFVRSISDLVGVLPVVRGENVCLDRKAVSDAVFSDKTKLKKLNEFTHSRIIEEAFSRGDPDGITVYEVPLLFEGGYEYLFDAVIVIMREIGARIGACCERDGLSREQVEKRIKNQFDYENYEKKAPCIHKIIRNDGDLAALKDKIERAISEIEK